MVLDGKLRDCFIILPIVDMIVCIKTTPLQKSLRHFILNHKFQPHGQEIIFWWVSKSVLHFSKIHLTKSITFQANLWDTLSIKTMNSINIRKYLNSKQHAAVNIVTSLMTSTISSLSSAVCFRSFISSLIFLIRLSLVWICLSSSSVCFSRSSPH